MSDHDIAVLERQLRELAPHLGFASTPDLATAVGTRLRERPEPVRRRTSGWLAWPVRVAVAPIAAAVTLVLALVLVLSPGARSAVADVLRGVPGIRVLVDERSAPSPGVPSDPGVPSAPVTPTVSVAPDASTRLVPGKRITLKAALDRTVMPLRIPRELGNPDEVYLDNSVRGGMLSAVWYADDRLPPTNQPGIGAVLTQFAPRIGSPYFLKHIESSGQFTVVSVNGGDAGWVEGGHRLEIRVPGRGDDDVLVANRLAANTLMWVDQDVTLRLETALPLADATRIAESVK